MTRCPESPCAEEFVAAGALAAHLVTEHLWNGSKAFDKGRDIFASDGKTSPVEASPAPESGEWGRGPRKKKLREAQQDVAPEAPPEGHVCPRCAAVIDCDFKGILDMETHAKRLNATVSAWKRTKAGLKNGRPREYHFDEQRAREMLATGMSQRAVAKMLGVYNVAISKMVSGERKDDGA